jgi:hypothetical protein
MSKPLRRPFPRPRWALFLLAVAFLAVGAIYNVTTPLFEAPDEPWHFAFVQHLSTGGGLPIYSQDQQAVRGQEGFQPPLYYLTSAPFISRLDTSGWTSFAVLNPQAALGLAHFDGNKNAVVHTDAEAFPYSGTALAVHLVRSISQIWGLITVLATFLLASEILRGSPVLAYAAAALVAFNPQFLFINSSVNNDPAVTALCTVALLLTVRLLVRGSSLARLAGLGVVLGLAAISKLNALPMFGLVALALLVQGWRERGWRRLMVKFAVVFGVAALVGGWWFARNLALYGDPLALGVWYSALGRVPTETPLLGLLPEMEGLEQSFWAVFGWMNVVAEQPVYDAIRLVTRLAVAGLAVWLAADVPRAWSGRTRALHAAPPEKTSVVPDSSRSWAPGLASMGFLALWLVLTFAMLLRYMQTLKGAQGRLLFPAISVVAIFLTVGLARLVPKRWHTALTVCVAGLMFLLAVAAPFRYIQPAYARPPTTAGMDESAIPNPIRVRYGSSVELLGYEMSSRVVAPGDDLTIRLYWRATAAVDRNYSVYLHLHTPEGKLLGQYDTIPGGGLLPTSLWRPGEVLVDSYKVPVRAKVETSILANLSVGLYALPDLARPQAYGPAGSPTSAVIARVRVRPPPIDQPPRPPLYTLGSGIALEDAEAPATVHPGEPITVSLSWRCMEPLAANLTVFLHLVNPQGERVAQTDSEPQEGALPTSFWERGEVVSDSAVVSVPDSLPPGDYRLVSGIYELATGQRLPVRDASGQPSGDSIVLGSVIVK